MEEAQNILENKDNKENAAAVASVKGNGNVNDNDNNKANDDQREKLPMEKKFNQWAYGGISYFAQAFSGSSLMYWIKFGSGRHIYDKMAAWLGPNFISKITKLRGAKAIAGADSFITVTTMVMVGNLFLFPLKWVEDRKNEIVEKWTKEDNQKREAAGEIISAEEKEHQQKLLSQMKAEPKQDWWSLGTARAFSLLTVYGTLIAFDKIFIKEKSLNQAMEKTFSDTVKKITSAVGFKKFSKNQIFSNVLNLGFFEGFYSMISAGGLFVYSHFVVPPKKLKTAIAASESADVTEAAHDNEQQNNQQQNNDSATQVKTTANHHAHLNKGGKDDSFAEMISSSKQPDLNAQMSI